MNKEHPLNILLQKGRPVICDGAMGTILNQRGVGFEQCFDHLNLEHPALVAEIHRAYIDAGAEIIQTNTFGANRFKLARHGLKDKCAQINSSGVELARRVVLASFSPVLIAGDLGPLGVRLAPFGRVQPEEAYAAFAEQIKALAGAGVDLLIIETMTDLYEIREAIRAARDVAPHLPVIGSMTFTRDDRTVLGDNPLKVANNLEKAGADILGINCSGGPDQILRILKLMRQAVPDGKYSVMPNAGWPQQVGGRIMYPATPDYFGDYALAFWQAGASLIGGCCGTTPQHIAIMREKFRSTPHGSIEISSPCKSADGNGSVFTQSPTNLADKLKRGDFCITVEMDPPRGLSTQKLIAGASLLAEAGADVINVADSPMARMRMSPWAVCSLIQREVKIETVLHFPTRGRNLLRVQGDLLAAHTLDVRNVFVVMGDPTSIGDYPEAMDNYDLVPSGLIKLIKQGFNVGLDHSGTDIGQPTSFFVGCALDINPMNFDHEVRNLRRKLDAGADFILTQPIFNPNLVNQFLSKYGGLHGNLSVPLLVGILPLANDRHAQFLHNEVPGIEIPDSILERMGRAGENGAREGIKIALELVDAVKTQVQGVYLVPAFSHYDHVAEIIEQVR